MVKTLRMEMNNLNFSIGQGFNEMKETNGHISDFHYLNESQSIHHYQKEYCNGFEPIFFNSSCLSGEIYNGSYL